jgi:hypothetical protein
MKKILAILFVVTMLFAAACSDSNDGANGSAGNGGSGNNGTTETPGGGGSGNTAGGIPSGTYSVEDDGSIIAYTFRGNGTYTFTLTVDGEVVLEDDGTYEIDGNIFKGTDSEGNAGELEFKLEGSTLTLIEAWFYEDLVLVKE